MEKCSKSIFWMFGNEHVNANKEEEKGGP